VFLGLNFIYCYVKSSDQYILAFIDYFEPLSIDWCFCFTIIRLKINSFFRYHSFKHFSRFFTQKTLLFRFSDHFHHFVSLSFRNLNPKASIIIIKKRTFFHTKFSSFINGSIISIFAMPSNNQIIKLHRLVVYKFRFILKNFKNGSYKSISKVGLVVLKGEER